MKSEDNSLYSDTSDSFRNKTLKEYQNDYPKLLQYYKTLNEDNDEINFIISEKNLIQNYIRPIIENKKTDLEKKGTYDLTNEMIKKSIASYLKIISFLEKRKQEIETPKTIIPDNKNLLFNGKDLNLSERFKIANKVLDIDNTLRKLKIKDLEKYKLLSYIINCSEDNARHLMNGKYPSKDRDLTDYFNELNLNK